MVLWAHSHLIADEAKEKYGELQYTPLGRATLTASIVDDREAIFTPCRYGLKNAHTLQGPNPEATEIVSFRGRFCEQAHVGETVRAGGMLERVENRQGEVRYRLLLGNSPEDAMTRA